MQPTLRRTLPGILLTLIALVATASHAGATAPRPRDDTPAGPRRTAPTAVPETPQACDLTDLTARFGDIGEGTFVRLRRHRPWKGKRNWHDEMEKFVGQEALVTERVGVDTSGCPVVAVDLDRGAWYWRVRDLEVVSGRRPPPFPQACGLEEDAVEWGAASPGTWVTLRRHRPVDGKRNWSKEMDAFAGRETRIRKRLGTDLQGCPIVSVEIDKGEWAWRVRDLELKR